MYNLAQLSFMNLLFTSELANIESWTQNWYSQEVDQRSNTHQADDIDWEVNPSWTDAHWVINLLRADTTSELQKAVWSSLVSFEWKHLVYNGLKHREDIWTGYDKIIQIVKLYEWCSFSKAK